MPAKVKCSSCHKVMFQKQLDGCRTSRMSKDTIRQCPFMLKYCPYWKRKLNNPSTGRLDQQVKEK